MTPAVRRGPHLSPVVAALEGAGRALAEALFGAALRDTALTVTTHPRRTRREALASYRADQWDRGDLVAAEINLAADGLGRPAVEILLDLARMLVHVRAAQLGARVASRQGRYCNRRFAGLAAEAGLVPPAAPTPQDGWGQVTWGPPGSRSRRVLEDVLPGVVAALGLVRRGPQPRDPETVRWGCRCAPAVGFRHRRQDLRVWCESCGAWFEIVEGVGGEFVGTGDGRGRAPTRAPTARMAACGVQPKPAGRGLDNVLSKQRDA